MHRRFSSDDAGFTLVEVIVAMVVFAIIVTGFLYVLTSSLTMSRDTRARVVAANLASQQIDLVRSAATVFDVVDSTRTTTLNGDTFTIDVTSSWATSSGATATCEAGVATGSLAYKQVTVEVTWGGMPDGAAVFADTSLTPRTKINDPTRGTVLIGVIDSAGVGVSGATVSLSPANGVASVSTDSDGCAYLLKVPADTYTVTVSKSGYISDQQLTAPTATVPVTAGSTSRASFGYDRATTFTANYANAIAGLPTLPTNLTTTYISTYGNFQVTASNATNPKSVDRYPISSGYSIVAGAYAETPENPATSCLAPDPGAWIETETLVGTRPAPVAGLPGSTVLTTVPMGVVTLVGANGSGSYLTAVYVGGGAGDPGCGPGMTYRFGNIVLLNGASVALPYGTWNLYRGSSAGSLTSLVTSGISVPSGGSASGATVILDPRVAP